MLKRIKRLHHSTAGKCSKNRCVIYVSGQNTELDLLYKKWCYLQIGYEDNSLSYRLGQHVLKPCRNARDLGITVQSNLKPDLHCMQIASKANARSKLILKSFLSHDPLILARAFVTYVRPLLKYCTPLWCLCHTCDIEAIENTQRTFTRKLFRMCNLVSTSYTDRLTYLGLQHLELCHIHTYLLLMFRLSHGLITCELQLALQYAMRRELRSSQQTFYSICSKACLKHILSLSCFTCMEFLPNTCFNLDPYNSFKSKIYAVDFTRFFKGRALCTFHIEVLKLFCVIFILICFSI